jgi:hypothetical protein
MHTVMPRSASRRTGVRISMRRAGCILCAGVVQHQELRSGVVEGRRSRAIRGLGRERGNESCRSDEPDPEGESANGQAHGRDVGEVEPGRRLRHEDVAANTAAM